MDNSTIKFRTTNTLSDMMKELNELNNSHRNDRATSILPAITFLPADPTEIVDYKYEDEIKYSEKGEKITYKKTTLFFRDGTQTSVSTIADKADQYMGFYICFAKHMSGGKNKINDEAEYWIKKLPKKLEKERKAEEDALAEEQRIIERDKKRREKKRVRLEAIRRKEAYDAAKMANEKYGVPMEWNANNK